MTDYVEYFLNSQTSVAPFETLEISHPDFTQTYWIVRNARDGITATLENAALQTFTYHPLRIKPAGSSDDLEQIIQVDLGDLGEIIPREIDAVSEAGGMWRKPAVVYRVYRSDDLTAPLFGPINLELSHISSIDLGSSFEARAPSLNVNRTGELYRTARFPMIRGFL